MGLRIIPDNVLRLGGRGGLRVSGGGQTYTDRVLALNPIAYWPLNEVAGTSGAGSVLDVSGNARHATPTSVTFGVAGIGDGETAAEFDGVSSLINIYTASLAAAFNSQELSICAWVLLGEAWSVGAARHIAMLSTAGFGSYLEFYKSNANTLRFIYAGSARNTVASFTAWTHVCVSISKSGDYARLFFDGVQQGTDLVSLGTWTNNLSSSLTVLGALQASGGQNWIGAMAHAAIFSYPLSQQQVQYIASP